jgi:hypothetical protein
MGYSPDNFTHSRVSERRLYVSICNYCRKFVAYSPRREALQHAERAHSCSAHHGPGGNGEAVSRCKRA